MFPDYVGRMVLDGVVNSDEWYFENVSSVTSSVSVASSWSTVLLATNHHAHPRAGSTRFKIQTK
jgi:hypothetical protein